MLAFNDVSFSYKNNRGRVKKVLQNINLTINKGETFALIGESGSGKSTLAELSSRLLLCDSGTITFENQNIQKLKGASLKAFYKNVQIVFQDPYSSLDEKKTICSLIEEPLIIHHVGNKKERLEMVKAMMDEVGLSQMYLHVLPTKLSGGLRQRVAIAIALIIKPSLVILDESVSALDVSIQAQVLNLLVSLQKKLNLTYLFITHDLQVVGYIADRIAVMYRGRIVEIAPTRELFDNPLHYYTRNLIAAGTNNDQKEAQNTFFIEDKEGEGCAFSTLCQRATERCKSEVPELVEIQQDHFVSCFTMLESKKLHQ